VLLAVDVGNTNVALGIFEGDMLRATWNIATDLNKTADEYDVLLSNLLPKEGLELSGIDHVSVACVVPPLLTIIEELCRRYLKVPPLVVGPGVKTGVRICTDNPREVGADRVVNSAAVSRGSSSSSARRPPSRRSPGRGIIWGARSPPAYSSRRRRSSSAHPSFPGWSWSRRNMPSERTA
jgi:hypothetical protein